MARPEDWSVKVRTSDSDGADALVKRYRSAGREAGRLGRRVTVGAETQEDAQAVAAEIEAAHPEARVQVRGD